ncbi:hypothetical protein [Campylobacter helveticus]|uniref:Uncharacterized protein n=1 Tax=Campylobacter helveticus TaxID=28898 RepID=A0AAX2UIE2_9BACT|nr:hypothetical protein [Campylobacter helveticus]MCR2055524.1 hypothetical protein [Campylobacter helveticus]MCR2059583.1 hypothetical protein [Campylobacter helveticus]TNB54080.1 hypothetical protein FDW47_09440 [Campylobacter helveticus]TNB54671.1 hypothetical protein FDW44_10015 [Campylobacter helveticus]TNB54909.1 hypothetical protein FDW42_09815 [Campylobacter helveticus]
MKKEMFVDRLEKLGLSVDFFAELICCEKQSIEYGWLVERYSIPNYVEPILNLLIELKNKYEAQGGNFDFLKEDSLEKKKEEVLKELEESKKILALIKENKALEAKILKLKQKIIKS